MPARGDDDRGLLRDKLLAELVRRQPLLAAINIATALLLAAGLLGAAPASVLAAWLGYMALSQAARLVCWRRWCRDSARQPPRKAAAWLVATSGMAGIGWGLIGLLFAGLGSAAQQLLVPFFLAGMAAGAVTVLSGHPPSFYAFLAPALLPYAVRLGLADEPAMHTMALTTLAYGAGLSAVAHQVHRSLRRSVELHLENARLVADLEEARRGLERRAERRAAELETVMETVPAAIWLTHDPEARWIKTNRQAAEMLRLAPRDNASLTAPEGERPRHFRVLKGGEEVPGPALPLQRAARGEVVCAEELRVVFDDGSFYDELISAAPVRNGTGKVIGAVGTAIDITERRRMEEALRQSEAKLRRAQDAAGIGDWELDLATGEIAWSERLCRLLRLDPGRIASSRTALFELIHPEDRERFAAEVERAIAGDGALDTEFRVVMPNGAIRWLASRGELVRDGNGRPSRLAGVSFDVTEHKAAEERIRELALQDPLTGLANRTLLQDRLRQMLTLARRGDGQVGLLLLDLDDFKDVNDTLGHPAGDRLLRLLAERLAGAVRDSDTLARLGGDEFAIVQPGLEAPYGAATLAQRLIDALAAPFMLDGQEVHISASIGIAVSLGDADADELIRRADLALYRAKREGRGRFHFFEPGMDAEVQARRRLERGLRRAIKRGEFVLHYQPQFDLKTDRVDGVEALVRWRHPQRGLVPPGEFIPAAEASGLVRPLGAWVLAEACRQARAWRDAGLTLVVAVNLSPSELRHGGVLHAIDSALRASGLDPGLLELEITEGLLLEHAEGATDRILHGLAARGVRLSLDDFGTGYSSLAYLRRLPVQRIKIDRSFVRDIGTDPEDEAVVQAIVSLGHTLGKEVVAEGVESEAQLGFLRELGCDAAQGFLLARPQAAAEVERLLAT